MLKFWLRKIRAGSRRRGLVNWVLGVSVLCGLCVSGPAQAAQTHAVDEATGVETWKTTVFGVGISLTQILPDQVRAFYINRGFAAEQIEPYAQSCVYMTVLRNDAASGVVDFHLADWRVVTASERRPPLSAAHWLDSIGPTQPGKAPMIAFRWAQFPPHHAYQPGGDWNQGMLSIGLSPGETFDLEVRWRVDGRPFQGELRNVRCAEDRR